jgi:hypothetical protein
MRSVGANTLRDWIPDTGTSLPLVRIWPTERWRGRTSEVNLGVRRDALVAFRLTGILRPACESG